jgi:hypothetical protein
MGVTARWELMTRAGCHLCDEMAELLDRECLPYVVRDVDADGALASRFGDAVPVLLRDGVPVAKVRLDRKTLERIVEGRR